MSKCRGHVLYTSPDLQRNAPDVQRRYPTPTGVCTGGYGTKEILRASDLKNHKQGQADDWVLHNARVRVPRGRGRPRARREEAVVRAVATTTARFFKADTIHARICLQHVARERIPLRYCVLYRGWCDVDAGKGLDVSCAQGVL